MTTTTVRRGLLYDVSVTAMLSSSLSHQTVFSCSMEIPGTQFSLKKDTMYMHADIRMSDRQVARGSRCCGQGIGPIIIRVGLMVF